MSGTSAENIPLQFERVWTVNQAGAVGGVVYTTIQDALDAIAALPPGEQPTEFGPHVIVVHPGVYEEAQLWVPNFVWIIGISSIACGILADSSVAAGDAMISIGIGGIENFIVNVGSATGDPGAMIFSRSSISVFTVNENDFGAIGAGDTLKVTPDGQSLETFTFAGTETTAQNVVDLINATAVNLTAKVRFGFVEIIKSSGGGSSGITVDSTGTANAALGFSTTADTSNPDATFEQLVVKNVSISRGPTRNFDVGVFLTDTGGGAYVFEAVSTLGGAVAGVQATASTEAKFRSLITALANPGTGLLVETNADIDIQGGESGGNSNDVQIDAGGTIRAADFVYTKRTGGGELIPAGSRVDFEFNVAGAISTGRQDAIRPIEYDMTIEGISMSRVAPGLAGTTTIDLKKGSGIGGQGSLTLYPTNPGNRFTFTSTDLSDKTKRVPDDFPLPDVIQLTKGEYFHLDVLTTETGNPQGLHVKIRAVVN